MRRFYLALAVVFILCGSAFGNRSGDDMDDMTSSMTKVGMVTDSGSIDDKSFNQGTWEGIIMASDEGIVEAKYLRPSGTTEADYIKEIGNLYDAGYRFIVTPGFKFATAIYAAQSKYMDADFVLLDSVPHSGDGNASIGDNTVSIFFAEHEAGFLAGLATALQLKNGEAGFIGGIEIPPVQKFNWGFQQGLNYANENMGTNITIKKENVIYQGSFTDVAAGQQIAASMYDKGVNVIFSAAGGVGVGAINEAKTRARSGDDVWIVGVDVDQYADGIYDGDKSIVLTSAMKYVGAASYEMIKAKREGQFPGGQMMIVDIKNDGVGLPRMNPNLDSEVIEKVTKITNSIKNDELKVSDQQGNLF